MYFASYLIIDVDEEKKKDTLKKLQAELEKKRKEQQAILKQNVGEEEKTTKKEVTQFKSKGKVKEQTAMKIEELQLSMRQKQAQLKKESSEEIARLEEIYKNIMDMVKAVKRLDLLSEEEFLATGNYK